MLGGDRAGMMAMVMSTRVSIRAGRGGYNYYG
jgi:hypothetical protein